MGRREDSGACPQSDVGALAGGRVNSFVRTAVACRRGGRDGGGVQAFRDDLASHKLFSCMNCHKYWKF